MTNQKLEGGLHVWLLDPPPTPIFETHPQTWWKTLLKTASVGMLCGIIKRPMFETHQVGTCTHQWLLDVKEQIQVGTFQRFVHTSDPIE